MRTLKPGGWLTKWRVGLMIDETCDKTTAVFPGVSCEKEAGHDGSHGTLRARMVNGHGPYFAWTDDAP